MFTPVQFIIALIIQGILGNVQIEFTVPLLDARSWEIFCRDLPNSFPTIAQTKVPNNFRILNATKDMHYHIKEGYFHLNLADYPNDILIPGFNGTLSAIFQLNNNYQNGSLLTLAIFDSGFNVNNFTFPFSVPTHGFSNVHHTSPIYQRRKGYHLFNLTILDALKQGQYIQFNITNVVISNRITNKSNCNPVSQTKELRITIKSNTEDQNTYVGLLPSQHVSSDLEITLLPHKHPVIPQFLSKPYRVDTIPFDSKDLLIDDTEDIQILDIYKQSRQAIRIDLRLPYVKLQSSSNNDSLYITLEFQQSVQSCHLIAHGYQPSFMKSLKTCHSNDTLVISERIISIERNHTLSFIVVLETDDSLQMIAKIKEWSEHSEYTLFKKEISQGLANKQFSRISFGYGSLHEDLKLHEQYLPISHYDNEKNEVLQIKMNLTQSIGFSSPTRLFVHFNTLVHIDEELLECLLRSQAAIYRVICRHFGGHTHRNLLAIDLPKNLEVEGSQYLHLLILGTWYDSLVSNDYNIILDFHVSLVQFSQKPLIYSGSVFQETKRLNIGPTLEVYSASQENDVHLALYANLHRIPDIFDHLHEDFEGYGINIQLRNQSRLSQVRFFCEGNVLIDCDLDLLTETIQIRISGQHFSSLSLYVRIESPDLIGQESKLLSFDLYTIIKSRTHLGMDHHEFDNFNPRVRKSRMAGQQFNKEYQQYVDERKTKLHQISLYSTLMSSQQVRIAATSRIDAKMVQQGTTKNELRFVRPQSDLVLLVWKGDYQPNLKKLDCHSFKDADIVCTSWKKSSAIVCYIAPHIPMETEIHLECTYEQAEKLPSKKMEVSVLSFLQ